MCDWTPNKRVACCGRKLPTEKDLILYKQLIYGRKLSTKNDSTPDKRSTGGRQLSTKMYDSTPDKQSTCGKKLYKKDKDVYKTICNLKEHIKKLEEKLNDPDHYYKLIAIIKIQRWWRYIKNMKEAKKQWNKHLLLANSL
jgi:hypothetical protein